MFALESLWFLVWIFILLGFVALPVAVVWVLISVSLLGRRLDLLEERLRLLEERGGPGSPPPPPSNPKPPQPPAPKEEVAPLPPVSEPSLESGSESAPVKEESSKDSASAEGEPALEKAHPTRELPPFPEVELGEDWPWPKSSARPTGSEGEGVEKGWLGASLGLTNRNWSSFFAQVGGLSLLSFVLLFLYWLSPWVIVNQETKVATLWLVSLAGIVWGTYLFNRGIWGWMADIIVGLGWGIAIATSLAGGSYYLLWNDYWSVGLSSLLLLGLYTQAAYRQRKLLAIMGLIDSYACAIFIYAAIENSLLWSFYLPALAFFALVVCKRCGNSPWVYTGNLLALVLFALIGDQRHPLNTGIWVGLWICVLLADVFRSGRFDKEAATSWRARSRYWTIYWNHALMGLGALLCFVPTEREEIRVAIVGAALILYVLSIWRQEWAPVLASYFGHSALALWFLSLLTWDSSLNALWATSISSLISLALSLSGCVKGHVAKRFSAWNLYFNFLGVLFWPWSQYHALAEIPRPPFWQLGAAYALPTLLTWFISWICWSKLRPQFKAPQTISLWGTVTSAYIYLSYELSALLESVLPSGDWGSALVTLSLLALWWLYALNMLSACHPERIPLFWVSSHLAALVLGVGMLGILFKVGSVRFFPLVNMGAIAFSLGILYMIAAYCLGGSRAHLLWGALIGWVMIHAEVLNCLRFFQWESLVTLSWILYATLLIGLALRLRLRSLHTLGLLILVLGVLRLVGYDLARLGLIYKMVALLVLAGASLLISRWYRRLQAKTSSLDPAAPQAPKVERVAALPPLTLAKEGPALEPAPIEGTLRVTAPIPKLEGSPKVSEGAEAAAELLAKMPDPQAPEVGFKPLEPPQPSRPFSSQAATAEEEPASQESLATTPQPAQPAHPFTQALQKRESGEEGQSPL